MRRKDGLDIPAPQGAWTGPDAYIRGLASRRSDRRARREPRRTQPEQPRPMLSTVPFMILLALLAVLSIAIMVLAFPGNQPPPRARQTHLREQGVAPRGWFQEAQKEMRR